MSYFTNDHLKISDIIIDFEENMTLITNTKKLLLSINNLDEFNNLKAELNEKLNNIENDTNILINTLKIIQYNIRKLYDDYAKIQCSNGDLENKLKAIINDNYALINKSREMEKQINYKNIIINEQNKHIKELLKSNKYNDKLIKDLKNKIKSKNSQYKIPNKIKSDIPNDNKTIANDKIFYYENFLNLKNIFNKNIKKQISILTENNNGTNIKYKTNSNLKNEPSEASNVKTKNFSTIDNGKYIFKDELQQTEDEYINNKIKRNETAININKNSNIFNKRKINNNEFKENIIKFSTNKKSYENAKDKILNNVNNKHKTHSNSNTKKMKRKGQSAKNIFKVKNKNFEFGDENSKLTSYFLFNLQREKILNNKNTFEYLNKK